MATIPEHLVTPCKSCRTQIVYAETPAGKQLPVDAQPAADGTVRLRVDGSGVVHAEVVKATLAFGQTGLHRSHFATCPYAGSHRRARGPA